MRANGKVSAPPKGEMPAVALHCFHGFGANTSSWSTVHHVLSRRLGALVTLNDMPGFGLTERYHLSNFT